MNDVLDTVEVYGRIVGITPMQAGRMFHRAWQSKALRFDESYKYDSHFDGGEWSRPAIARMEEKAYRQTMAEMAMRLGVSLHWLERAVERYEHSSEDVAYEIQRGVRKNNPRRRKVLGYWLAKESNSEPFAGPFVTYREAMRTIDPFDGPCPAIRFGKFYEVKP